MPLNFIILGMIRLTSYFWSLLSELFWFRSLKIGQNLLQFQANLVKDCVNLHYVWNHNFYNNLNQETSEPILESKEVGL